MNATYVQPESAAGSVDDGARRVPADTADEQLIAMPVDPAHSAGLEQ
ncbi:hypothetical protein ACFV2N_43000 [Streptomyces sp. NPDC059680]